MDTMQPKKLIIINILDILKKYTDENHRLSQKEISDILEKEYEKGNYVIAGGDFNQSFPGVLDKYPIADPKKWTPGVLEESILPEGWQFAFDSSTPTCRLLDQPLSDACQRYVIDGFILSPNVQIDLVETLSEEFEYSDHNPVRLDVTLLSK